MIKLRKSNERGYFDHGWLKSFHSFSFANYYDPNHIHFGNLRVINEDSIAAGQGFGKHPHQDMEIITYVISGALSHKDSMGNSSTIFPGEVQIMSAGNGVFHSEFNHEQAKETHLLQIWILPDQKQIMPRYDQKSFENELQRNELVLVVSGSGKNGSLKINQNAEIFLGKFSQEKEFEFVPKISNKIWIQIVTGNIKINEIEAEQGDGIAISKEEKIKIFAEKNSEFLLFDL